MRSTHWAAQTASILKLTLSTILQRKGSSAAAVFGIAGVVAVFVAVLSIAQGFRRAMTASASPEVAVVMRGGSDTEMMSLLTGEETRVIADAPQIAREASGPLASAELFTVINLPLRSTGTDANVPLRGVQLPALEVRSGFRLLAGRCFVPGCNEVIVGRGAANEFGGLRLGDLVKVGQSRWKVVGIFAESGGIAESEIWTDAPGLQSAFQRGNSFQSVYVRLRAAADFPAFKALLGADPRLNVKALRQSDYYVEQSSLLYRFITGLGRIIAALMAVGAIFGALNTMYTTVAERTREIATLRALGFGAGPVVSSVLLESLLLGLAGGVIGGGTAYLVFDGFRATTINWQSFSQVAFAFDVNGWLLLQGLAYALLIGGIGGLLPGLRAARLPVARALREL